MDPVSQILTQSGAGSADGAGFGQFAAQGAQIAQENRRLNLMEQRQSFLQRQESMLMPLQMEAAQLNNEKTGLTIQSQMKALHQENAMMSKMPELIDVFTQFTTSPRGFQDPELLGKAQTILGQAPMLAETEIGKSILGSIAQAPKLNQAFEILKRLTKEAPEGSIPQSVDPSTGRVTFMQEPRSANLPANIQEANEITRLETLLQQTTDPAQKEQLQRQLNNLRQQTAPRGNIIRTNADGSTEVIMGANVGDLTPSQRGVNKQQSMKLEDTARRIGEIVPKVNEIFGPLAASKTIVVDRVLANLVPGLADGQRIQGRVAAGMVMEGMIRSLSEGQGQLSNQDIQRLKSKFPELNNLGEIVESPERAKGILIGLQKELVRDAYGRNRILGEKPSDEMLSLLDPAFVIEEFKAGRLTPEQVKKAGDTTIHAEELQKLLEQLRAQQKATNGK